MELKDKSSTEIVSFFATLEELEALVNQSLKTRLISFNGERYFTSKDLCNILHISLRTLQEYRDTGLISYIQISGKILYKESDILELLEGNYINRSIT